eukprot:m.24286 g.24286  ORF g.24286 m.24286 type:complete len:59 (-) comp4150_c0_seq3:48-224(-)
MPRCINLVCLSRFIDCSMAKCMVATRTSSTFAFGMRAASDGRVCVCVCVMYNWYTLTW